MGYLDDIKAHWLDSAIKLNKSPWFIRLQNGQLDARHYKGYLLETFHHTSINPQIQAFCTMYFRNNPRELVGKFLKHAFSEIGHDLMAAKDLMALGVSEKQISGSKPLPSTVALNAYVLYSIQFISPLCYLGYLFHLEFLPTTSGNSYIEKLAAMGVPPTALTFLKEHATVDVGHNALMKHYVEELVQTKQDAEIVMDAAQYTCCLHQKMMEDAFMNGEKIFGEVPISNIPVKKKA